LVFMALYGLKDASTCRQLKNRRQAACWTRGIYDFLSRVAIPRALHP
jgi:hypothetical protein